MFVLGYVRFNMFGYLDLLSLFWFVKSADSYERLSDVFVFSVIALIYV